MKTNNPIIDNMMDAQANVMNTWMDSAKKFQSAFANGNVAGDSQSIFKDMMEKQTAMFNGLNNNGANPFGANPFMNNNTKPEEYLKNWYNQQMVGLKQFTDFNQSIYNSMVNYGKNANDYNNSFSTMNTAWTNIYNSWMNTMNTSYDTFSSNMNNPFNKDMFKNMYEGGKMYMTMFCCADCARGIIQSGIKEIIAPKPDLTHPKWGEHFSSAIEMLTESNVKINYY